jgi:hypothetical protein
VGGIMKARKWFFALGQSHEARRMPYALCVGVLKLNTLPHWVKQAYSAGRLSVPQSGFRVHMAQMAQAFAMPHLHKLKASFDYEHYEKTLRASVFTAQDLQDRMRLYDPEATASEGVQLNTVDVLTTLHPHIVQDMVPLGVKVNQRYRGSVPMVRIEQVLVR